MSSNSGVESASFGVEAGGKWFMISHGKKVARLHRPADQRKALLRNLTTDLLRYGRITTTMARAKAMRKPVEHMIQLGKDGGDHKKRQAEAYVFDKELVESLKSMRAAARVIKEEHVAMRGEVEMLLISSGAEAEADADGIKPEADAAVAKVAKVRRQP